MTDLDEIKRALAAATQARPGDSIYVEPPRSTRARVLYSDKGDGVFLAEFRYTADAELFARAPAWLAQLVERVERAEFVETELREALASVGGGWRR